METGQVLGTTLTQCTVLEGDKEPPDIRPFELYLVLQVSSFNDLFGNHLTGLFSTNYSTPQLTGIYKFEATPVCNASTARETLSSTKLS